MDERQMTEIVRQAARIVREAEVGEHLEPSAFRVVAEALLLGAPAGYREPVVGQPGASAGLSGPAINEFLATLGLSAHTDRFVAIAYRLLRNRGQLTFSVRDLQEVYTLARERKPKNFAAIAGQCANRGLFAETGGKLDGLKEWQITKTGEAYVEKMLSITG